VAAPPKPTRHCANRLDVEAGSVGAMLTLLAAAIVAAVLVGQRLRQSTRSAPTAPSAPVQLQPPPASVAPVVPGPAEMPRVAATPVPTKEAAPMADLSELLQGAASTRMRWARFKANPAIVVIEYPNLHEQGLAMNRLAAMFEKRMARRDRVPTEAELAELMRRSGDSVASFYQGHDYPAAKVARFFSLAEAQHVTLNAQEMQLRSLMLEAELITRGGADSYQSAGQPGGRQFHRRATGRSCHRSG
jgi:hypothetical protein